MTDENPPWDLERHLAEGRRALIEIEEKGWNGQLEPVCHHFWSTVDPLEVNYTDHFEQLAETFDAAGVVLEPDRLEAWEETAPTEEWLERRIPVLFQIAAENDLGYQGWSFEPRTGQPVCATDFVIINNRTAS